MTTIDDGTTAVPGTEARFTPLYPGAIRIVDDAESDRSDRHNSNPVGSGIIIVVFILSLAALIAMALTDGGL